MALYPITRVGGIDATDTGTPSIKNTAQGVNALGIDVLLIGQVVFGQMVNFDFVTPATPYPNRFTFGEKLLQSKVGNINSLTISKPTIHNSAFSIAPKAIAPPFTPFVVIGGETNFDFIDVNQISEPYFHFGKQIITKVGAIDGSVGMPVLEQPISLRPFGISSSNISTPMLGNNVDLNFHRLTDYKNRFNFGGSDVVTKITIGDKQQFGHTSIVNSAIGVSVPSLSYGYIPKPAIAHLKDKSNLADKTPSAAMLNFDFNQTHAQKNTKNIPFYFNVYNHAIAIGTNTLQIGNHHIRNTAEALAPIGFDAHTQGKTSLINDDYILPDALDSLTTGLPVIVHKAANSIQVDGIVPPKLGTPNINTAQKLIHPPGFDFKSFGTAQIQLSLQLTKPAGINAAKFGQQHISNHKQNIKPTGIYASNHFGQAIIANKNQIIKTGNLDLLTLDEPRISFRLQHLSPAGLNATLWTPSHVTHAVRYLYTKGSDHVALGKAWISHHTRFIDPIGIEKTEQDFASNHAVMPTQFIHTEGFEATDWLTRIIPDNTHLYPDGMEGKCGTPAIDNHTHYLLPKGFGNNDGSALTIRFGKLQIFNHSQYIIQDFIPDSGLVPQVGTDHNDFGKWVSIVNRNKTLITFGVDNSKFGYSQIDNKAAPVLPTPIESEMGKPMIGYRVRKLPIDGIEAPHFSYWHIIRNTARVLSLQGFDNQDFGTPALESNLQTIKQIFPFENNDVGTPMITDRVRFLGVEWRYSISPPTIALPTIDNHTRYITTKGFDGTNGFKRNGRAELIERFNIIKAHGREHSIFGADVIIKNLTPEARAFGHNSAEFGTPAIRNEWREILPFGNQMSAIGTLIIKDRKQTIKISGLNANRFGVHTVKRLSAPPYSTQYIELRRFDDNGKEMDGYGVGIDEKQVSTPTIRTNVLAPKAIDGQTFGKLSITANSIHIDSGIFELSVGSPRVWIKQQYIKPKGLDYYVNEDKMGKPQLSPHTIYAPSGENATGQARRNHPTSNPKPIDGMVFGQTTISNQHRAIFQYHYHGDMQAFGQASIGNKDKVIKTRGFRGGYFGWHIIPFVPQSIEQFSNKPHKTAFGTHTIGFIGEQQNHIRAGALVSMQFGNANVSHFHRAIYPHPFVATQMGRSIGGDTPFMWQGLRIGERILGNYGGFDTSVFGDAWISNKIREINVQGFDSFVSEADIKSFKGRLAVKRAIDGTKKSKQPQAIGAVAIAPPTVPVPNIKNKVHYIRPDGNSEQFRKGAW